MLMWTGSALPGTHIYSDRKANSTTPNPTHGPHTSSILGSIEGTPPPSIATPLRVRAHSPNRGPLLTDLSGQALWGRYPWPAPSVPPARNLG